MSDIRCKTCGTWMEEVASFEDGNYRDHVVLWCPECGTSCGAFREGEAPEDYHWRFPRMASLPEVGAALSLMRDGNKVDGDAKPHIIGA